MPSFLLSFARGFRLYDATTSKPVGVSYIKKQQT